MCLCVGEREGEVDRPKRQGRRWTDSSDLKKNLSELTVAFKILKKFNLYETKLADQVQNGRSLAKAIIVVL